MERDLDSESLNPKTSITAMVLVGIILFLIIVVITTFINASKRTGTILLPGGVTYLGDNQGTKNNEQVTNNADKNEVQKTLFSTDAAVPWVTFTGKKYPYTFSHPKTLPLKTFDTDSNDSVAIDWGPGKPEEKVLISVIDLTADKNLSGYIAKPKKTLVENWWKLFSGLTGIASFSTFTNSHSLTGYRAIYVNTDGQTPNIDIFYEVPGQNNLMIRVANGVLEPALFERIVESVSWKK